MFVYVFKLDITVLEPCAYPLPGLLPEQVGQMHF